MQVAIRPKPMHFQGLSRKNSLDKPVEDELALVEQEKFYTGEYGHVAFYHMVARCPDSFIRVMDQFFADPHASKETPLLFLNHAFANPNLDTASGVLLSKAIEANHPRGFKLLMRHPRLNVHKGGGAFRMTPLHTAAAEGNLFAIQALLDKGAIVDQPDRGGITPLMTAVQQTKPQAVSALIAAQADVNAMTGGRHGLTPLQLAVHDFHHAFPPPHGRDLEAHLLIIRKLLEAGANGNALNEGETELMRAINIRTGFIAKTLVQALIVGGVDLNVRANWGRTALDYAEFYNKPDIAELIQTAGGKHAAEL